MVFSSVFNIAGSALTAQGMRLNAVASNLASIEQYCRSRRKPYRSQAGRVRGDAAQRAKIQGVRVKQVVEDATPGRMVYDPRNPAADERGYVMMPNVSVVDEMVNMISASRSYQTNADVMNTAKQMLLKTLALGQ